MPAVPRHSRPADEHPEWGCRAAAAAADSASPPPSRIGLGELRAGVMWRREEWRGVGVLVRWRLLVENEWQCGSSNMGRWGGGGRQWDGEPKLIPGKKEVGVVRAWGATGRARLRLQRA